MIRMENDSKIGVNADSGKSNVASEPRKRQTAYKLRIGDLLKGKPVNDGERFGFLELGARRIVRVNVVANVIEKYEQDNFASITIDDASGQVKARVFRDDIGKLSNVNMGDTVIVIGQLRVFNNELYIVPEIVRMTEPGYLLVRKLELEKEKSLIPVPQNKNEVVAIQDQILNLIKKAEQDGGIDKERLIMEISAAPDLINEEIHKLLEEGICYEPRPGRVRFLG